jgi:hypothetical protein
MTRDRKISQHGYLSCNWNTSQQRYIFTGETTTRKKTCLSRDTASIDILVK